MPLSVQDTVHGFLQAYYQRMKTDTVRMSNFYATTAELTHINYQIDADMDQDVLPTVKVTGKDNISKFLIRNAKKVSDLKVRIDFCDFQSTVSGIEAKKGILIVVFGEMFWTGTPTYRFSQTFILMPTSYSNTVYDVTNDILRFIPDDISPDSCLSSKMESENNDLQASEFEERSNEIEKQSLEKEDTTAIEDTKEEADAETRPVPVSEENPIEIALPDDSQDTATQEVSTKPEKTPLTKEPEQVDESSTLVIKEAEPVKMTWAAKISNNTEQSRSLGNNTSIAIIKNATTVVASDDFVTVGPNTRRAASPAGIAEKKFEVVSRKDNNSNRKKGKQLFSTVNKDGFYPIYIRGTTGLSDEKLKFVLNKKFGPVAKINLSENFAVVDFEYQKSQTEALEKRRLVIDDIEIFLERKTLKKQNGNTVNGYNNNTNNSSRTQRKYQLKKRE